MTRATQPTQAVIKAVAEAENLDPIDLNSPLYDAINPEALNSLFDSHAGKETQPNGKVIFEFHGYVVIVTSDGNVVLEDDIDDVNIRT